jgi:hypothetical protein
MGQTTIWRGRRFGQVGQTPPAVPIAVDVAPLAETNAADGQDLVSDGYGQWGAYAAASIEDAAVDLPGRP